MLILVILLINVNGQILKKVSECMGACHYCYSAEPTKCIANSSLIIPCDQGYVFNKTVSSCVLRPPFQSNFTDLQFTQQRQVSIQQKHLTAWKQGKVQQCSYKNSKGIQKYLDVIGLFKQVQSISKQFQVSENHEIYLFSFNLVRNSWMPRNDFLIIDVESGNQKLSSYEISYQSRQSYQGKSVISCQNQTLVTQKFNIKIFAKPFLNNKIKITFTGFLLTSLWGITNINFIPGCQRFSIYNKLTGGCDFCDMGYFPINQRMSIISKNQLIRCQKCAFQCNHCMNDTFCYSCIKGYKLVSFKCVPDEDFIKVPILQTVNSEVKTCKVMNYSFFINSQKSSIQTININQVINKPFGNGFMVFEFVYNTKFQVNCGNVQIKVNNIKVSQITAKNLTNKGFGVCSSESFDRYSIQKLSVFVGNVSKSVNFSLNMVGTCKQCKYGFAKLTFIYMQDKSSDQNRLSGSVQVLTTNKININSVDTDNIIRTKTSTTSSLITTSLSDTSQINKFVQNVNKQSTITTQQTPVVQKAVLQKTITEDFIIQSPSYSQKIVNQNQAIKKSFTQIPKVQQVVTQISTMQSSPIQTPQQQQTTIKGQMPININNNKLDSQISQSNNTQQTIINALINKTKNTEFNQNFNSQQHAQAIITKLQTQIRQQPKLNQQQQIVNQTLQIRTKDLSDSQQQKSLRVRDEQQKLQSNLTIVTEIQSTQNKSKIQYQQPQNQPNQNIQTTNFAPLDLLAFSVNGNNGLIVKLNKSIIPFDLSNTEIVMQLSSPAQNQLQTNKKQHVLYNSISQQNDTSFPLLNSPPLSEQQTLFAFYTDRTYLNDKVTIYSVKNNNDKREIVKFSIQRTDFLDNKAQNVLSGFQQLFHSFAWFIIFVVFVAILTAKMYLIQETIQIMQFIFFSVYIFTSYLPGSIVNTISGLRRLQNLDFLPESFILSLQKFLLGDLVQQSPLRLTLFHRDINFIRGIIPIILLLSIIIIWFLFIVIYDRSTRKQGDQHDQDGIYGDNIVENNINFGPQNFIQWFRYEVVRKIARNKLDYWTQVLKIVYLSLLFSVFKQFNNFKYPDNYSGEFFNILFCLISFIVTIGLLIGAVVKSSKKYYKLQYGNFLKSFPAIYYKKIPKNCLPTQNHLLYNPLLKMSKPILFCLLVALVGNHPTPIFILILIMNVIQILFAWMHDIYQDTLYFKFLIVESTIFTVMLMILMIISCISGVISTNGYLAFGYVFMAFSIVVIISAITRSGYLIVDYAQKQIEVKEKAVQSSRIV